MPHCTRCNGWISALVYECPACGEKPKGPPPQGIIASDVGDLKRDELATPPAQPQEPAPAPPVPGPYVQAPGPTTEDPAPIAERPVRPAVAPRPPAPRPPAPPKTVPKPQPARPEAPITYQPDVTPVLPPLDDGDDELEDDIVEVVRKPPEEGLPDLDKPVG